MLLRCAFLLWASLANPAGFPQGQPATVTLSVPPTRLVNLLPLLAEKTGLRLEVGGEVREQVVVLNAHDVPTDELLSRIAEVSCAEWSDVDGRRVLSRSMAAQAKLAAQDGQRLVEMLGRGLARLPKDDKPFDSKGAAAALEESKRVAEFAPQTEGERKTLAVKFDALRRKLPTMRLIVGLLRDLGPDVLAKMEAGETVLSDKPTPMQARLGSSATRLLDRFTEEQNTWAAAVAKMPGGLAADDRSPFDPRQTAKSVSGPVRAILKVRRASIESTYLDAAILIVDGSRTVRAADRLTLEFEPQTEDPDRSLKPLLLDPTRIVYSPKAVEMGRAMVTAMRNTGESQVTPGLLDDVLDPERVDPLALSWLDGFRWVADRHRLNLIAWVPDGLFAVTHAAVGAHAPDSGFSVARATDYAARSEEIRIEGGWLLSKPRWPARSLASRTDRRALSRIARLVHEDAYPSIENIVGAAGGSERLQNLAIDYCSIAQPARRGFSYDFLRRMPILRLLNGLSATQKSAVLNGQMLTLRSLPPADQALLARCFFRSTMGTRNYTTGWKASPTLEAEPTEAFPNGLPPDSIVSVIVQRTLSLSGMATQAETPTDRVLYSLGQIGKAIARGADAKNSNDPLRHAYFSPMATELYQVSLEVPGPVGWFDSITMMFRAGPATTLNSLPAPYLDEIRKASGSER
jgi:hypothetical protein